MKRLGRIYISIVVSILLLGQVVLPISAQAENDVLNWQNPNETGHGSYQPYKLALQNITPGLLTSVVSCTDIENKLAGGIISATQYVDKALEKAIATAEKAVKNALTSKAKREAKEKADKLKK